MAISARMFQARYCALYVVQSSIIVARPLSDQELRNKAVPAIKWHLIGGSFCINFVFYPISAFYLECAADYFLHEKGGPLHSTNDQVQFYQMFVACKNVEVDYEWSVWHVWTD